MRAYNVDDRKGKRGKTSKRDSGRRSRGTTGSRREETRGERQRVVVTFRYFPCEIGGSIIK